MLDGKKMKVGRRRLGWVATSVHLKLDCGSRGKRKEAGHNMPTSNASERKTKQTFLKVHLDRFFLSINRIQMVVACDLVLASSFFFHLHFPSNYAKERSVVWYGGWALGRQCWSRKQQKSERAIKAVQETGRTNRWAGRQTHRQTRWTHRKECLR